MSLIINGKTITTDAEGYLINVNDWNEAIALAIAQNETLTINEAHWEIIYFLRDFYAQYQILPTNRALVKAVQKSFGDKKGNSMYLYQLFPQGPVKQACKIAGLPKPAHCI